MIGAAGGEAVIATARAGLHVHAKEDSVFLGGGKGAQVDAGNFRGV